MQHARFHQHHHTADAGSNFIKIKGRGQPRGGRPRSSRSRGTCRRGCGHSWAAGCHCSRAHGNPSPTQCTPSCCRVGHVEVADVVSFMSFKALAFAGDGTAPCLGWPRQGRPGSLAAPAPAAASCQRQLPAPQVRVAIAHIAGKTRFVLFYWVSTTALTAWALMQLLLLRRRRRHRSRTCSTLPATPG